MLRKKLHVYAAVTMAIIFIAIPFAITPFGYNSLNYLSPKEFISIFVVYSIVCLIISDKIVRKIKNRKWKN